MIYFDLTPEQKPQFGDNIVEDFLENLFHTKPPMCFLLSKYLD